MSPIQLGFAVKQEAPEWPNIPLSRKDEMVHLPMGNRMYRFLSS